MHNGVGIHPDGGHLFLRVQEIKDKDGNLTGRTSASWLFRYFSPTLHKQREAGLGVAHRDTQAVAGSELKRMRDKAAEYRRMLDRGLDPLEVKKARKEADQSVEEVKKAEAKAKHMTLRRHAHAYIDQIEHQFTNEKHRAQWASTVLKLLPPDLLDKPVGEINPRELLSALVPICKRTPETGRRLFQRVRVLFDAAVVDGLRDDNPALPIKAELSRRAGKRQRTHFEAMPYQSLPAFVERLRKLEGASARALEFLIVTAARTTEVLTAEWGEIDRKARTWLIPAGKMKAREAHLVYLNDTALAVLERQQHEHGEGRYVFPSARSKDEEQPMSQMALLMQVRRLGEKCTVHGFRSSYSTACYEIPLARRDAIEASLAHKQKDRTEAAYNRAEFLAERRALAVAWGEYIEGRRELPDNVVEFARKQG
jgi:integrase